MYMLCGLWDVKYVLKRVFAGRHERIYVFMCVLYNENPLESLDSHEVSLISLFAGYCITVWQRSSRMISVTGSLYVPRVPVHSKGLCICVVYSWKRETGKLQIGIGADRLATIDRYFFVLIQTYMKNMF